jgi:hypothetical protein
MLSARSILLLILAVALPATVLPLTTITICRTNGTGCGPSGPDYGVLLVVMIGETGLVLCLVLSMADDSRQQKA